MTLELEDLTLIRSGTHGEFTIEGTGRRARLEDIELLKDSPPIIVELIDTPSGTHAYNPFKGEYSVPERANALLLGNECSIKDNLLLTKDHLIYAGMYCVLKGIPDVNAEQPREGSGSAS